MGESKWDGEGRPTSWLPAVYEELRRLAENYLAGERSGHTLQPTALVHEAYVKLVAPAHREFQDRTHFLASAARAMREILVDHARARKVQKRGGPAARVTLHEEVVPARDPNVDVLILDDAIRRLSELDSRKADTIVLRLFGGMTIEETAESLGVSHMTVSSDWRLARAWLAEELDSNAI